MLFYVGHIVNQIPGFPSLLIIAIYYWPKILVFIYRSTFKSTTNNNTIDTNTNTIKYIENI